MQKAAFSRNDNKMLCCFSRSSKTGPAKTKKRKVVITGCGLAMVMANNRRKND
jgi:hypothetical protein